MIQISLWVQAVGLGGLQQGEDRGAGFGTGLGIAEKPVLPTDDNRADRILHMVIADFDLAVVEERAKVLPLVQRVGDGFLQLACRTKDGFQPGIIIVDNGLG